MIKDILLVGLGGGLGSILRYLSSNFIHKFFNGAFPLATFTVNILGCFLVGILFNLVTNQNLSPSMKLLFITGFCGGFTTFSAFALENVHLFHANQSQTVILYTLASVLTGFAAVWLGMTVSK